ncbi:hypothetical protein METBIDRAFT_10831 [Metschnikowia bicuspidata var. bicuspidata NRRL YB-4993]|uniref:Carboxypeptidase n=1 Tax=Metschnikowia bicuspidata var. bicuspidata NRRL YB-4993 TaxID=869754 RepID=A0A1A0HCT8_9ASCO|nr:hypothetical protein METBIDRAFT_10831 [Metschnikowia bicuspidata var. bicuspidata NRRL YB-4993]OBA21914.1 hypothetical protein METBIDRAFT_10831 [Metschnikowia bicuspidata var. bicuspidata NRRL YB-4993]
MKVAALTTLACAVSGTNAAFLPDFSPRAGVAKTQQVLAHQWDHVSAQYADIMAALDEKKGDVYAKLGLYLSEPGRNVPKSVVGLWQDVFLAFPQQVSQLAFKTTAKPSHPYLASFDFHVSDASFPNHKLRVKSEPGDLGIDSVKQYTGYLDIEDEDKHFFYWFFESRNDPANDPVILWLNGGPGCSSLTGLFFELGPSLINAKLQPEFNPYAWNNNASVLFLDQPVNVGFSYSLQSVSTTTAAAVDVYAFLELFFKQFAAFRKNDFHIAGESYAGRYIPLFAAEILRHPERSFNLKSVLIGNGMTDPLVQNQYYQPMACGEGGVPLVLSAEECATMAEDLPHCTALIESCYHSGSVFACVPASIYCNNTELGPYRRTGKNLYDMRKMCDGEALCYGELQYVREYLNLPEVHQKLGVEVDSFKGCNNDILNNFLHTGDVLRPSQLSVIEILEAGLPVLLYAGDQDFICNWLGNRAWSNELPWSGHDQFRSLPVREWTVGNKTAGEAKNYENLTFLRIFDAGHMVPYDQPENSLDMVNRWISGDYVLGVV